MGIFQILAIPLGWILRLVYQLFGNYFIAIFFFPLLVKLVTFPFSLKSQKATADRARLAPRLERLQKKYGQDRQKLQQKTQELYEKEGSKSIFPTVAPYSVDHKGNKHALRGKERSEYQKTSGKEITQQLDDLFASNAYKQATSEQQVDMIADLIGYSTAEAKTVFLKGKDITYEKSGTSKTIEKLAASGVPASATVLLAATDRSNDKDVENSGAVKAAKTIVALNLDAGAEQVMLEHFGSKAVATAVKYLELMNGLFMEVNPIPVKTALSLMGWETGTFRLPLCEMSESNRAKLRAIMERAGLPV
jgi:hypothetical protein